MDQIAKAKYEGACAYWIASGDLSKVDHGYKTKCMRDAFIRGWNKSKWIDCRVFPFLKRIQEDHEPGQTELG